MWRISDMWRILDLLLYNLAQQATIEISSLPEQFASKLLNIQNFSALIVSCVN